MFRLIGATLVALYCIALVFGDEARRPAEVARAGTSPIADFSFADWVVPAALGSPSQPIASDISDEEAIQIALAAGRAAREGRTAEPLLGGLIAAVNAPVDSVEAPIAVATWYVTGNVVNVRSGPGTGNPVVGQVTFGDGAKVLGDPAAGWIEIKPEGTATTGWISARFLAPEAPG